MASTNSELPQLDPQYTPFYCEENVYLLCKTLCTTGIADAAGSDLFAVFISNEKKQIPLWHQKASKRADGVVLWDYHVICIQRKKDGNAEDLVWDLDSSLPFPSPLTSYVSESIQPSFQLFSEYERYFRVVHAPLFLSNFASDRRHMKDSKGRWMAEPPPYQPIVASDGTLHNLNQYNEIRSADALTEIEADFNSILFSNKFGVVVAATMLEDFFSKIS